MGLRKVIIFFTVLLLLMMSTLAIAGSSGEGEKVYVIPLEGPVEKGLASFLTRSFKEAENDEASLVIIEIDTQGGALDAALEIGRLISNKNYPVYAYVTHKAYSAGAYIALSTDRIYMTPGSVIGAAQPISLMDVGDEAVDEKTVSAFDGAMRSAAQAQGKDPNIASAMVRKEISIDGVVEEGKLLTLTSSEAEEVGISDGTYGQRWELLQALNLEQAEIVETKEGAAERLARLITNPTFATILLTVAMAALFLEIMTAGFGVAGSISLISFTLFFGGHIFAGFAGYEVVVLFVIGIILLLIEAFIPNFGIVGATGIVAVGGSVVLSTANTSQGIMMFLVSLIFSIVLISFSLRFMNKKGFFKHIILSYSEEKDLGYIGPRSYHDLVGKKGSSVTPLRPSGTAIVDGKRMDVVSEGGYVGPNQEIEVIHVEGVRIVVKPLENNKG